MGMTIDTVDKWLKIIRQNLIDFPEVWSHKKIESLDTAVSYLDDYQQLMQKFQKIQTIVKAWDDMNSFDSMVQISEVLKDGNND